MSSRSKVLSDVWCVRRWIRLEVGDGVEKASGE